MTRAVRARSRGDDNNSGRGPRGRASREVHTVFRLAVMTPSGPSGALQRKLCTGKYDVNRRIVDPELAFAGERRRAAVGRSVARSLFSGAAWRNRQFTCWGRW